MIGGPVEDPPQVIGTLADRVLTVTLNRPEKLNAFTGRMSADLPPFYPWWPQRPWTPLPDGRDG